MRIVNLAESVPDRQVLKGPLRITGDAPGSPKIQQSDRLVTDQPNRLLLAPPPADSRTGYAEPVYDSAIPEVSGACFAGDRLVLVGDSEPVLAWAHWTPDGPGAWRTVDVASLPGAPPDTGQFEAVEHLRDDTVVILCEEPALLLAVDVGGERVTGSWRLEVDLTDLAKPWRKDANSRGEGFFFGPDRVFVVKEKKPAALVEFAPRGRASIGAPRPGRWTPPANGPLTAVAWHRLDLDDVSDACVVGDQVWLLSDQERVLAPLSGRPRRLPAGISKPEGLTWTPEGRWLVAVDNDDGRDALFTVDARA